MCGAVAALLLRYPKTLARSRSVSITAGLGTATACLKSGVLELWLREHIGTLRLRKYIDPRIPVGSLPWVAPPAHVHAPARH
mmetsp:Transcript_27671/g.80975  ORF Transcript_27671/g.80975 Transcript_27671/m.80975 type:complete len:82 (-) Transcript_27671:14-259(-)